MKKIFAAIRTHLESNVYSRKLLTIIYKLRLDGFIYFICDLVEPNFGGSNIEEARKIFWNRKKEVISLINHLEDEKSKRTYKALIRFRITGNKMQMLKEVRPQREQYFMNAADRKVLPLKREYFVDCGAFTGDTWAGFLKANGTAEKYYAFEPNKCNYTLLMKRVKRLTLSDKVEIYPFALSDIPGGVLRFDMKTGVSSMSRLSEHGTEEVKVTTLDKALQNKKVTFIKMDIEGAELPALRGAEQTILKWKPTLAISIYHSNSDMLDIYLYISRLVPEYKFYVRHYSVYYNETVLYAVMS